MFTAHVGTTQKGIFSSEKERTFNDSEFVAADLWTSQVLDETDCDTVQYEHADGPEAMRSIVANHEAWREDVDAEIAVMYVNQILAEDEAYFLQQQEVLEKSIYAGL